jgi:hypothetical protein
MAENVLQAIRQSPIGSSRLVTLTINQKRLVRWIVHESAAKINGLIARRGQSVDLAMRCGMFSTSVNGKRVEVIVVMLLVDGSMYTAILDAKTHPRIQFEDLATQDTIPVDFIGSETKGELSISVPNIAKGFLVAALGAILKCPDWTADEFKAAVEDFTRKYPTPADAWAFLQK